MTHAGSDSLTAAKEGPASDQPAATQAANARAREAALAAASRLGSRPAPLVAYHSGGRVLVIGPGAEATAAARRLGPELQCMLVVTDGQVEPNSPLRCRPSRQPSAVTSAGSALASRPASRRWT